MFDIDKEHPEYAARKASWRRYRDLYAGGEQFKRNATEYLIRRQREPGDVYTERLSRVFYENYIGSIVDWYAATLFRREPVMTFEGNNASGKTFFSALVDDCDRKGTCLTDFFRRQFIDSLIMGGSYVLVDFPRAGTGAGTRGAEDAVGASRAYLVDYPADDVINWSLDEQGNFDWVVIRTKQIKKDRVEDPEWRVETQWAYYDKQTFRIYGADGLADEGMHGLAKLGQVPLYGMRIPEGLWMLNRAASLQLEHFNKSNALGWALTMGLFAMPVVYSEREWSQMVGEELLHPTGAGRQIRMDGARGQGLSDCGGQFSSAARRDLSSLLLEPRWRGAGRARAERGQQAERFLNYAGSAAGVWGRGEGSDPAGAAGYGGGSGGRAGCERNRDG